jgi:outer membrane protein assembly factor BamB
MIKIFGCQHGTVYTLTLNGTLVWKTNFQGTFNSPLTVDPKESLVFYASIGNAVISFNYNQELLWTHSGVASNEYIGTPVIWEDKVYVASTKGSITVLNKSGQIEWSTKVSQVSY